jgi:two-component system, sensor histidine kinase
MTSNSSKKTGNKNLIVTLVKVGTRGLTDEESINRIKLVNSVSVAVGFAILVIGPVICYFLNWQLQLLIPLSLEFIINGSVIVLNHYRKYLAASITLYYLQCVSITYFGFLLVQLLHLEFVIVLLIAIIYLIFKDKKIRKISLAAALAVFAILEIFYYKSGPQSPLPISYNAAFIINTLVVTSIIGITILVSKPYVESNDTKYELKRANHFIKIFTAQVTHELRSPLNAIHQIAQLLVKEVKKDEHLQKIEPLINMSLAASCNTRNIVNNVLDMAQIESGKTETIVREAFLIRPFFTNITEVNKIIAQVEHIKLRLSIGDLPPVIVSDPLSLNQIVTNLLANAIKYSNKGSTVTLKIDRSESDKDKWTIQVINQGPGIPPEKLELIFDPFTTNKPTYTEGTGLGLYIVKKKVTSMNGTIQVESDPNSYTVFTVTLSLSAGNLRKLPEEEEEWDADIADLHNIDVLIAEDHKLSALMLFIHLNELGCNVTSVKNGWELLQSAEKNRPDIIIMDYHMPVMDGEETLRLLKQDPALKNIPVIVTTGDLFADAVDRLLEGGADTYIEKPIDIKSLQKTISRYLPKKNH